MTDHSVSMPHRSCYINFAEHLQNHWNPNMFYPGAPNIWTYDDWEGFLKMIRNFGYNVFEFWLPPTLYSPDMISGNPVAMQFIDTVNRIIDIAHDIGLKVKFICAINTIGAQWYYACPNDKKDHELILNLWRYWNTVFAHTDIVGIFPGDPGGCNRNGCTHETYIKLALELAEETKKINPHAWLEINTWGTPFSGWGDDLSMVPDWDGTFSMLQQYGKFFWHGDSVRAQAAMEDFVKILPSFPQETMVGINLGFSPDGDAIMGGDARKYAREISKIRPIVSWDYSVSEGELINYPHWRLPRMSARRREEVGTAPYQGGMVYTMSPKLNLMSLYAGAQFLKNPDANPDIVSREFCSQIFGKEHAVLGELFEAFEVVKGWGHYPRRAWSKPVLMQAYSEMIDHLESADASSCSLPIFPDFEEYRQDLLWFARMFLKMTKDDVDRQLIGQKYRERALLIYNFIPQPVDNRASANIKGFSSILA